jgi:hypothetical protein
VVCSPSKQIEKKDLLGRSFENFAVVAGLAVAATQESRTSCVITETIKSNEQNHSRLTMPLND